MKLKELQSRAARLGMVLERKRWYSKQFGTNYSLYCNVTFVDHCCKNLEEVLTIIKMREVEVMTA
jgi:hypothetical protein